MVVEPQRAELTILAPKADRYVPLPISDGIARSRPLAGLSVDLAELFTDLP